MGLLARVVGTYRDGLAGIDRRAYLVVTVTLVSVASRMSLYTFLGIHLTKAVGFSLATVGLAYLAENLVRGLAAPIAGAISDRQGRRVVLVSASLATAAVLPLFLLVTTPVHLFVWAVVLGVAQAGLWPVASALLLDLVPGERRQAALSLNYTALSIGYTIGVAPAGFLLVFGFGFLAGVASAGYVLIAVLLIFLLRGPLPATRPAGATTSFFADIAQAPRDPAFLLLAALGLIFPMGIGLIANVAPLYAKDVGLGEGAIGLALAVNGPLLALLAIPVATWLAPRGPYRYLPVSAALLAASFVPFIWSGGSAAIVLASVVFTLGELVFSSALPTAVAQLAPEGARGAYQGAWGLVFSAGVGLAVFVTGVLEERLGWRLTWIAWVALTALAALGLVLARSRFRRIADARAAAAAGRG